MRKTIISLVSILVSVLCLADTYRILKLSPSPVVIGGVNKKVQDTFTDQQEIKWQNNQGMWVADLTNGGYRYFSKEAFDQKNAKNVYAYLKTNHPSTRDGYNWKSVQCAAYDNEKRLALVIGNSNYVNEMSLRNPIADAAEISNRLRGLGFDVMVMYDASKKDMEEALQYFRSAAYNQKYGTVLFYYAGHGLQYADKPFLIPSDAKVYTGDHVKENCISGGEIVSYMNETQAETKIAIFDACRSEKSFLRGERADFKMDGLENGIIIFSTKGGYPANDGGSDHSPFAEALLSHMNTPDLGASELLSRVISDVKKSTKDFIEPQIPNMTHFSLDHSFYFTKKVATAPATTKTGSNAQGKIEVPSKSDSASGASMPSKTSTSTQTPPNVTYTGKLVDGKGVPLSGATLICKKNNAQTTCNANGEFQITVPQGATITVTDNGQESSFQPTYKFSVIQLLGFSHQHEWVDLGLPSGLLWATCNVGALTPGDYGDYFAWGETSPKLNYTWKTHRWCDGSETSLTKYKSSSGNGTSFTLLDLSDDAAHHNWGSPWRMPTKQEFEELMANCTQTWTTQDGNLGCRLTSKINNKSIFLPAGGTCEDKERYHLHTNGEYWTSNIDINNPDRAWFFNVFSEGSILVRSMLHYGSSIRPVRAKVDREHQNEISNEYHQNDILTGTLVGHDWVDLGLPSGLKWATCNVGAAVPEDCGDYFAWGETTTKSLYAWKTYKWGDILTSVLRKYNTKSKLGTVDNKIVLDSYDDAAQQNWGSTWRMPTSKEFDELKANCIEEWAIQNGQKGLRFTSKINGNTVFFPAAGEIVTTAEEIGRYGVYWSSSLSKENPERAESLIFSSASSEVEDGNRFPGNSIRPVTE